MARELFFRMCEFSRNNELNKAEATKLYVKTLDIVKQVWAVEAGNTNVTIGETDTKTVGETVTDAAPIAPVPTDSSGSGASSPAISEESAVDPDAESSEIDPDAGSG